MPILTREFADVARHFIRAAPDQGGIVSGANPSTYNPSDPFPLWIIQVFIILGFAHILAFPLRKLRQPTVVAEIIGGIILGPTVMGRIPHFTNRIFPPLSIPLLTLTSTIGLVLFLFLIGLEIDVRVLKGNARSALTISAVGMIIPFSLGVALAVALYHQFVDPSINFGHFLLFVGVAVSITAFPVLCRILTDLNLLDDHVGVIVLGAGVGNDVVGWILLALAVALTNASSGLTALWILLAGSAFVLFMMYPARWSFVWLARRTGSLENGSPTPMMMTVTLLVIFASAFYTDVIGIHPIFGGFIAGLIVPHEGGFAIALVEKLEDLVCLVLIPLYFALSGLKTNLGLLTTGVTWGYIVLICTIAFLGKFLGCAITAKFLGFNNRESGAIGTLMSCKGLVELIVLNIGFQANILDTRLFSMFVLHALVLTVMTTPLTLWVYPPKHRTGGVRKHKQGQIDAVETRGADQDHGGIEGKLKTKLLVVLNRIEHLPAIMIVTQLLQPPSRSSTVKSQASFSEKEDLSRDITQEKQIAEFSPPPSTGAADAQVSIEALRLIELTDRTSAVMKSSEADEIIRRDPLISIFSTFGRLNRIPVATSLSIISQDAFPSAVATQARDTGAELVIVPWHSGSAPATNILNEEHTTPETPAVDGSTTYNPFDGLFGKSSSSEKTSSVVYSDFTRKVFAESPVDVALFLDRGNAASGDGQHIFLPFFGGPDDRLALRFMVQLCANPNITATALRVKKTADGHFTGMGDTKISDKATEAMNALSIPPGSGFPDTIYGHANTEIRIASDISDNILWSRLSAPLSTGAAPLSPQTQAALNRISFAETASSMPLRTIIQRATAEAKAAAEACKSLLVVVGRARRLAVESHAVELRGIITEHHPHGSISGDVTRTLGEIAAGFVVSGTNANVLVMQAAISP